MSMFEYLKPSSVKQACEILIEKGGLAQPLAGGTDLLVKLRKKCINVDWLIDLKGLDLMGIKTLGDGGISIGSLSTLATLMQSEIIGNKYSVLKETLSEMASVQICNRATIGGNLCNASPAADLAPALIAMGAKVVLTGAEHKRELNLESFLLGPGVTDLNLGEIMTDIILPPLPKGTGASFFKLKRNAMDLSLVSVAVQIIVNKDQTCSIAKIVFGAVAPTPVVASKACNKLSQRIIDEELISEAAALAKEEIKPIDDVRASSKYRRSMVNILTQRAVKLAYQRALEDYNQKSLR